MPMHMDIYILVYLPPPLPLNNEISFLFIFAYYEETLSPAEGSRRSPARARWMANNGSFSPWPLSRRGISVRTVAALDAAS
jgi:hypothetical protein